MLHQYVPRNGTAAKTDAKTVTQQHFPMKTNFHVKVTLNLPDGKKTTRAPNIVCVNHVNIP